MTYNRAYSRNNSKKSFIKTHDLQNGKCYNKTASVKRDSIALSFYYGKQGVKVIPNIRYGVDELANEFLSAIPQNTLIAIGTHGFIKETYQKAEWYCFLEKVVDVLHPTGIVIYGTLSGKVFDEFRNQCDIFCYEPWIYSDRKRRGGVQNGD